MSVKVPATRRRIGKYEMGKTLGEGSFAKVKVAKNVETGESVAIKILDRNQVLRHKMVEQIKREISTMKLIKHPNVIKIIEVMASKTKIFIVLELVDGGELFDKIANNGRLTEDEARSYFQQLINAVDYCHSRGVYHRDLKADGLLHTACGTPNYVAPEVSTYSFTNRVHSDNATICVVPQSNSFSYQVLNDKGYDGRTSDVWSCGVILFVLMAGFLPFDETNLMVLYKKICRADFFFPSWFSPAARKFIQRILDPNPLTRLTIPEILNDEWFIKGYKPPQFDMEEDVNLDDVDAVFNDSKEHLVRERKEKPVSMNAFGLISRAQSFSLENLFEKQMGHVKRETRFSSQRPPHEIMSKIEEAAKPLGFNVRKGNYKMKLQGDKNGRKGQLSVATEVFEVAPCLHIVEVRKTGGDTLEFNTFYKNFSTGLKDIVWKTEENTEESKDRNKY